VIPAARASGAHALGPEAGECLHAGHPVPRATPLDTIQPLPSFPEALLFALMELGAKAR